MKWVDIELKVREGDLLKVITSNSMHVGFFNGVTYDAHIPRIILSGSNKFIFQPQEKQCRDHTFSIDIDKIEKVWIMLVWGKRND